MQERAKLTLNIQGQEQTIELPVIVGSENEKGIDISSLLSKTGHVVLDPAFMNTASTTSAITYIDGDKGILRYRGIPIEQLGEKSTFVETAYLLIYGKLPNKDELHRFSTLLTRHSLIHEDMKRFYDGFPRDAHPMAILSSVVSALSTFYQDSLNPHDEKLVELSIHRLLAKLPTIAAYSYKKS
ncbi:MAG: citrate/2-methylcitrate synthase, partial [Minicystis sp.]